MKKKVLIRGPILTASGYGEHARMVYRALKSESELFDLFIHPVTWGQTSWLWEDNQERRDIDELINKTQTYSQQGGNFDIALLVTIPNEWERVAPVTIGITAGIESSKVSAEWLAKTNQTVDKVIVPSEFSAEVFKKTSYKAQDQFGKELYLKLEKPIEVIGYPVKKFDSLPNLNLNLDYDFNFLCIAQAGPRKNLEKTIDYFYKTFKDKKVGLVLKISKANNCVRDKLFCMDMLKTLQGQYPDALCKTYLLHGFMTDSEIHALYVEPKIKCLLSLTHGEGFGLPLFEAAYSGLPIISHEWGGQTDFLFVEENGKKKAHFSKVEFDLKEIQPEAAWQGVLEKDSKWAYPKEFSACTKMMEVYKDHGRFKGQAKKLKEYLISKENQNFELVKIVYGGEIKRYNFNSIELEQVPKISFVTSVFKGEEYIEGFMQDITRQTIFKEKCELVLVNCNSPENEEEVIQKYQKLYPDNIKYIKLDEDPGIYDAWNLAIKECTGEFVSNANLDDRKAPDFAEKLAKLLVMNPDVDCVYTENLVTAKPHETFENNSSNGQVYPAEEFSLEAMLRGNPPHCMPMWRKSIHEKNGYFDQKYKSAGDWDFWLRCSFNGSKYLRHGKPLGLYYFNPKGMSTNPEHDSWKREHEKEIFKKYMNLFREKNA